MKHLMVEKIIEFVSAETFNDSFVKLASEITTHIRECEECRCKVRAFQTVYDELKDTAFDNKNIALSEFKFEAEQRAEAELSEKKDLNR